MFGCRRALKWIAICGKDMASAQASFPIGNARAYAPIFNTHPLNAASSTWKDRFCDIHGTLNDLISIGMTSMVEYSLPCSVNLWRITDREPSAATKRSNFIIRQLWRCLLPSSDPRRSCYNAVWHEFPCLVLLGITFWTRCCNRTKANPFRLRNRQHGRPKTLHAGSIISLSKMRSFQPDSCYFYCLE